MKKVITISFIFLIFSSCDYNTEEINKLNNEIAGLREELTVRNNYLSQVTGILREVYISLDDISKQEGIIQQNRIQIETGNVDVIDSKEEMLRTIEIISATLKMNREKLNKLKLSTENNNLNSLVYTLKQSNNDYIAHILELKQQIIKLTDKVIVLENELDKVFCIAGSYSELKNKGILSKRGGILGLGRNFQLSTNLAHKGFEQLSKKDNPIISIHGIILDLFPARDKLSYIIETTPHESLIKINNPELFWENKYLVIILRN
jgi:hypothetical protein